MVDLVASVTLSLKTLLVLKQPWNTKVLSLMVVQLDLIYHRTTDVVAVVAEAVALVAAEVVVSVVAEVVVSVVAEAVVLVVAGVVTVVVGVVAAALEVDLPVALSLLTKAKCKRGLVVR